MNTGARWLLLAASTLVVAMPRVADASSCIPGFDYAAFGRNQVTIGGNSGTDSYDSAAGNYATTNTPTSGGNLGTNSTNCGAISAVELNGASTTIGGNINYGANGTPCAVDQGSATVHGTEAPQTTNISLPSVTAFPTLVGTNQGDLSAGAATTISAMPNNTWRSVDVGNGKILTLNAGTYVFDNLSIKGEVKVTGAVTIYFKCATSSTAVTMNAGGLLNDAAPQKPGNMILMLGPNCANADFTGGTNSSFAVYGPDTDISLHGGTAIYGSIVGKTITASGGVDLHYDRALQNLEVGQFACVFQEYSRSSPVIASITPAYGGAAQNSIVQGTFEAPNGAPTTISSSPSIAASITAWKFPYIRGHTRARMTSGVSTTASDFAAVTCTGSNTPAGCSVLFDAGAFGKIPSPPANYGNCTTPNGTCRYIFTNTNSAATDGTTWHPSTLTFNSTNASTIGAMIAPTSAVSGIGAANWLEIVKKVLDARLGGVDRSTVAVVEPSTVAGSNTRATMAYFGATDGMLHAVCASQTGACAGLPLGTELWAFAPRVQLPLMRTNLARIDGSPRVIDAFADFTNSSGTGTATWKTVLVFQTGYNYVGATPATYALDITDPANPTVLWEATAKATPGTTDIGAGLTVAAGPVLKNGRLTYLAVVQTNNGGSGGAGVAVTALNLATGAREWEFGHLYTSPPRGVAADLPLPATGVPGGAVGVDLDGTGFITDFVFGDLYGQLWRVAANTGVSRNGAGTPLFRFGANKRPIGTAPAIYSNGGTQYAVVASGGYADPSAAQWSTGTQYLVGVKLASTATTPVTEATAACSTCAVSFAQSFTGKAFAQVLVVGTQLFVTVDSQDVNSSTYGTTTNTGTLLTGNLSTLAVVTSTVNSGASSLVNSGTSIYSSGSSKQQQTTSASTTVGSRVDGSAVTAIVRMLWLRSE